MLVEGGDGGETLLTYLGKAELIKLISRFKSY